MNSLLPSCTASESVTASLTKTNNAISLQLSNISDVKEETRPKTDVKTIDKPDNNHFEYIDTALPSFDKSEETISENNKNEVEKENEVRDEDEAEDLREIPPLPPKYSHDFRISTAEPSFLSHKRSVSYVKSQNDVLEKKTDRINFDISLKPPRYQRRRPILPRKTGGLYRISFRSKLEPVMEQCQGFSYLFPEGE